MRNINQSVKFVVSSIIPTSNSVIYQANKALKKVCSEDGHHFQDNDSDFLVNNHPIPSMYYDHIHINRDGTYAFGTQLKHSISSVSNTSRRANTVQQGSDSRAKFPQGRPTGRSQASHYHNQNSKLYYMSVPPWMMNQDALY